MRITPLPFLLLLLSLFLTSTSASSRFLLSPSSTPNSPVGSPLAPPSPGVTPFHSPPAPPSPSVSIEPSTSPSPSQGSTSESSPSPSPASPSEVSPAPAPVNDNSLDSEVNGKVEEGDRVESGGLSAGAKAGIVLTVLLSATAIFVGGLIYKKRKANIRRSRFGY